MYTGVGKAGFGDPLAAGEGGGLVKIGAGGGTCACEACDDASKQAALNAAAPIKARVTR
jgi:hypothetical protein